MLAAGSFFVNKWRAFLYELQVGTQLSDQVEQAEFYFAQYSFLRLWYNV